MPIYPNTKPNVVVFCGAGFSVPMGIPAMNRFSDQLRASQFLSPEEQADLDLVQNTCNSLASMIGASARNLEQLASFLSILQVVRPDFRFDRCSDAMSSPGKVLRKVVQCMSFMAKPDLRAASAQHALDSLIGLDHLVNLTFVTTNYDMHIEFAAVLGNRAVRGLPDLPSSAAITDPSIADLISIRDVKKDAFALHKLHGSVNWIDSNGNLSIDEWVKVTQRSSDPTRSVQDFYLLDMKPEEDGRREAAADDCKKRSRLIIPPVVLKPSMLDATGPYAILRQQWESASKAISEADRIWFIGYSFPETDSFMRYFLGASLFNNVRAHEIVVVDPDRRVVEERARPIFAAPHHREIFRSLPVPWHDVRFDQLLNNASIDQVVQPGAITQMRKRQETELILGGMTPPLPEEKLVPGPRGRGR